MHQPELRARIEQRIAELRTEAEMGHKMMAELDTQRGNLQRTLLRIGGAIEVLEELTRAPAAEGDERSSATLSNGAPAPSRAASSEMR